MLHQLDALALLGEDALGNHYNVIIPPHPGLGNIVNLNMRVTSVSIPAQAITLYTITKKGKTLTRVAGVSEQGNEITFNYRPDKCYDTYKGISRWMSLIKNPTDGTSILSDSGPGGIGGPSFYRVPIIVQAIDANNIINAVWTFLGCWPSNQSEISFSEDSGEPLDITVTMQYATIIYPIF
jgi:hypothetical protein